MAGRLIKAAAAAAARISVIAAVALAAFPACDDDYSDDLENIPYRPVISPSYTFRRGISYAIFTKDCRNDLAHLHAINRMVKAGPNWVAVTPTWYQDDYTSTTIAPDPKKTPCAECVEYVIGYLHSRGAEVMLKPHVSSRDGVWRGDLAPADTEAWFKSYRGFIHRYAEIAERTHVGMFCVGCELDWSDGDEAEEWARIISGTRHIYNGPMTYAASASNYKNVCFWDDLEYVGIDAYFQLSERRDANLGALVQGWELVLNDVESWVDAQEERRYVIFTEVGYTSRAACWVNPGRTQNKVVDTRAQELCYKALFMTAPRRPWLKGTFIWWWGNPSTHDARGGPDDGGFTPYRKPAEKVLSDYYNSYESLP